MNTFSKFAALALVAAFGAGCASTAGYDNQYTAMGAASGAVLGGVLGHQINSKNGRYAGAATGALIGGLTGYNADRISRMQRGTGIHDQPTGYPYQQQPYSHQQPSSYPYQQPSGYSYQPYPYQQSSYYHSTGGNYAPYPAYR